MRWFYRVNLHISKGVSTVTQFVDDCAGRWFWWAYYHCRETKTMIAESASKKRGWKLNKLSGNLGSDKDILGIPKENDDGVSYDPD